MKVFVWKSFSCNNSSDFRLVARFKDAKKAAAVAAEMDAFFKKHAVEGDEYMDENDFEPPEKPLAAQLAIAKKYGLTWPKDDMLVWGDEGLSGDEPEVRAVGDVLVLYHTYCGGFGKGVPKLLALAGAKVERETSDAPTVSVKFTLPSGPVGEKLRASLGEYFAQGATTEDVADWKPGPLKDVEFVGSAEDTAWASDGKTFEFYAALRLRHVDDLKKALAGLKVKDVTMKLCAYEDKKRISALQKKAAEPAKKPVAAAKGKKAAKLPTVGKKFLFTGKMVALSRADGEKRVKALGGVVAGSVGKDLDYLVIGDDGSPLFGQGVKGSKMIAAEKLIAKGAPLRMISENEFMQLEKT